MITINELQFKEYISAQEIAELVKTLGTQITADYNDKNPLFVVTLKGSFIFAADLIRSVAIPCQVDFLSASSYAGGTESKGELTLLSALPNVRNRHIILVEDIVDTGLTLSKLVSLLQNEEPASLAVATLLFKPEVCKFTLPLTYVGKEIPPDFIVGYGLDYAEYGRNLPDIYVKC